MPFELTSQNFDKEVNQSTLPILIDVYAPWCSPCKLMLPIFEELSHELAGKCKLVKLNIDNERHLAISYKVSSVPTFVFIKNNVVVAKETGYMSKDVLLEKIEELLLS